jgi:hypothetical protein
MKDSRIKISTLIENQIPKYLRESSPLLIDFLRQYYISVESKGQVLDILENIDQYINIDTLTKFKKNTKLTNNISFFDNSIQVESTLGFPDSYGLIKINDEIISYESKTQDTFTNCFRGFSGIESYGDSSFEKNVFFKQTEASEHIDGNVVENLSVLFLSEFLGKIKKQILPGFEDRTLSPKLKENIFIKQSKDFYSSKGNKSSFEILFKALYGEKVSLLRPSEFLIEPSKSNFLVTKDIVVEIIQGNPEELINQTIRQNEDEYFPSASSTVTKVERIFRGENEYYVLSLDFGYDRDLETRGSFTGDFQIHPKTKIIGGVSSGQDYIDVDSTAGFPNSGVLVVNREGIDFTFSYKSKSLNQFFECENVPNIEDGLDIKLDTYAFAISPFTGEEIRFRIGGVLSDLNISEDTILSDVGDTIRVISPGKIMDDIRTKNWLYNISVTYDIKTIRPNAEITTEITTFDEHNFILGDNVSIISSVGGKPFNSTILSVVGKKQIVIKPPLVSKSIPNVNIDPPNNPQQTLNTAFPAAVEGDGVIDDATKNLWLYTGTLWNNVGQPQYKIKRKISKSNFKNYPELVNLNSNVQNVYENVENNSIYITSPSIPNYFNSELLVSDRSTLINGLQINNQIKFSNAHSFLTGDVVEYSYGNTEQNLNIKEGPYYVKKISNTIIKLYKSHEDILLIGDIPLIAGGAGGTLIPNLTSGVLSVNIGGTSGLPVTAGGTGGTPVTSGGIPLIAGGTGGTLIPNLTSGGLQITIGGIDGIPVISGGTGGSPVTAGGIDRFLTFDDAVVVNNKITPYLLANKKLTTQKLVRKITEPKFNTKLSETKYGSTGIFLNGVEISNYKSNDYIYYGPIENVQVTSDLSDYDIISPNIVKITDPNGVGAGSSVILHINGGLKKVNILDSGFDYLNKPKVKISGGNGDGCKVDVNLINFTHSLDFNSENINSVNLSDNIITFSEEHKFRDIEEIVYKSNENNAIGGLVDFSNYFIKSISSNSIQIYSSEQDALVGINTINLTSLGQGLQTIESTTKKKKISSINVLESGVNYSNKKIIVNSGNVNDKKNTIFAKNHGYKNKEIVKYTSDEQVIGGLSEDNYYVKFINDNEFSLIEILEGENINPDFNFINNTIVKFENKGLGNHIFNYPEISFSVEGITGVNTFSKNDSLSFTATTVGTAATYTGVTGTTSGNGVGAEFDIERDVFGEIINIDIVESGIRYAVGDTITILGSDVGGTDTIDDVTITITGIDSRAKIQPIFRGKIENVFVQSFGKNYGSSDIINFERQPVFNLIEGSRALLKPIILNGRIEQVLVLNKGINYNTPPEIQVIGEGSGAILTPVIENGNIKNVIVLNKGTGYGENSTNIVVETNNLNINTKLRFKIKSWNINNYVKLQQFNLLTPNQSLLVEPLNENYGLQYKHISLPDSLRRILFISKIVENEEYYISDKDNDGEKDLNILVHSPIVGWAYDGNPIYGPYGFDTPQGGRIRTMRSGYTLSTLNLQNRPNYPSEFFVEDYTFNDAGDLDIHNGRFCVTPEFPNGIYAYFCTIDEEFKPKFPYVIGNFYKSTPIKFNFDKKSNQDAFDVNVENLIRNTNPYKFLSKTANYDYAINPNSIKNQNSKVSSVLSGSIDFIEIISPGDNYRVDEPILIETSENDTGFGALAKISNIFGKEVETINTEIKDIDDIQFSNSNIFNNTIGIAKTPHNLLNGDLITIKKFNIDDIFLEEKFYKITVIPTELTLTEDVGDESQTGLTTYFSVNGNLNYPFVLEDDIFVIGEEEIKILNVDLDSRRIKVLRGINSTTITEHFRNDILNEKSRKIYFDKILDKNYEINRKYYFNPEETVGVGITSGVGIGTTLFFSSPGVGITQIFIPTKTLYFKNHNLNTGDKLIYNTDDGVGIKVSNDGTDEFLLNDDDLLYVAKISDNLIGISTNKVALSPQGDFVGIGTTAGTLFFKDFGAGLNHSFITHYEQNLTRTINNIKSKLTTKNEHFLQLKDTIKLDVSSLQTKTFNLFYDLSSRNLAVNKTLIESVNGSTLTISNHNFDHGQKVLFNSSSSLNDPENELFDGKKYYVMPLNTNQFKLSKTYFGSFNNKDIVNISNLENDSFLSLINPPIDVFKNATIIFDLSDPSLIGFDFNIFEDSKYNNIFYGVKDFNVFKNGVIGSPASNLILNIKDTNIKKLYYTLTIPNVNDISFEKLEYFNDDLNVLDNNTIILNDSVYSGEKNISGIGTNFFEFNLNRIPESLNYTNNVDSLIKYTTKSKNTLGPISEVKIISKGKNYKKLPIVKEISTESGTGAFLKVGTNSIGKIQKIIIENIGFNYFSDNSLRPFSKIPEVLRVNPLSTLDEIRVIFFGEQYNVAPDLILLDGITGKIVDDVTLDFNLDNNLVSIIKNTNGINDVTPTIIPVNNTNGINISLIEPNYNDSTLKVVLNESYSNISEFPFSEVVAILSNDVEIFTTEIFVDDSSKIPEQSLIKIFNPKDGDIVDEVLYVKKKIGNKILVQRGFFNTQILNTPFKYEPGSLILLLEEEVLIENVKILDNSGNEYNSVNYNYKMYKIKQISPQLGGGNPFILVDFSNIINNNDLFGIYDINSSFGKVTPKKYFPIFEISLKKNIFSVGETVISGNNTGIVEFWDSKNELLKINTIDDFTLNQIIVGKSTGYRGQIMDKFKFKSFYDIDSSSIVIRSWQDSVGFLNEDLQRIHNNEYYQYFSYSLKSIIQYNDWESAVGSLNHISGFKKFSDLDVEIKNPNYISKNNVETPYVGIETNQNNGNFTSFANIDSFAKFSCKVDYDLVSENSDIINSKLISDQIYFESKELVSYFDCIGNRVLSVDDISVQFRSQERINVVNRFTL